LLIFFVKCFSFGSSCKSGPVFKKKPPVWLVARRSARLSYFYEKSWLGDTNGMFP
jgi:hypothetical protein